MCGVVGISFKDPNANVAKSIYYALYALQHRGQESAGISVCDGKVVSVHRAMGLVSEVFDNARIGKLKGSIGVGHVRYSTTGESSPENSQPVLVRYKDGAIAVAHNGNLVNSVELRKELESANDIFYSTSDTEVIAHLFIRELLRHDALPKSGRFRIEDPNSLVDVARGIMRKLVGSYSLVLLLDDTILAIRGPLGIKPLCIGEVDSGVVVASESVAIDTLNGRLIRDVRPGEVVIIRDGEMKCHQITRHQNAAHCVFEYIYFARPDSIMDGRLVYDVRVKIGGVLAEEYPVNADTVAPVPDSGITFAVGYHQQSDIDYLECLMKNRYIGRTFIMPGQEMRETAVRLKMNTIRPNIEGKKLVLVDDSIVRGTTSRRIVDMVKNAGAKEVHIRIGSPQIVAPCYLGIDMASRDELIAAHKTLAGVEAVIGAKSLGHVSHSGLVEAVGISEDNLCMGCLNGIYPIEIPGEKCRMAQMKITEFMDE